MANAHRTGGARELRATLTTEEVAVLPLVLLDYTAPP